LSLMDRFAHLDLAQILAAAEPLLKAFPGDIWLACALIEKPNGKLDKPPLPGFRTNRPASWVSLGAAIARAEAHTASPAGVGFMIVEKLITFDFDDCVSSDGCVAPAVAAIIEVLDSFSYVTVSGTGMRVVCLNDADDPIPGGKFTGRTADDGKVEVFVGPVNFHNTFSATSINSRPLAPRGAVIRRLLKDLTGESPGITTRQKAATGGIGEFGRTSNLGMKATNVRELVSALMAIPPDFATDREAWVKLAGAVYAATEGSERGRRAFLRWCEGWQQYNDSSPEAVAKAEALWDSFEKSPPRAVGAGTIYALAKAHGWTWQKQDSVAEGRQFRRFADAKVTPSRDFIKGVLETDTLAMIFGPPGAGKTFAVLDLLLHVAWGRPWFGHAVQQGPALLFAVEGGRGVEKRIVAFRQHYQLQREDLPFRFNTGPVDLSSDRAVEMLITAIKAQGKELGAPVKVAAIDVLAMALGGSGERRGDEPGADALQSNPGADRLLSHPGAPSRQEHQARAARVLRHRRHAQHVAGDRIRQGEQDAPCHHREAARSGDRGGYVLPAQGGRAWD
jgi:AAA domain/Primase C terminal 2 (PriCT-2)